MQMKFLCLIALSILLTFNAISQVKVTATLEKNSIVIGQQIKMIVEVEMPVKADVKIRHYIPGDSLADFVEVVEVVSTDSIAKDQKTQLIKQTLLITSFDSGAYMIPPVKVLVNKLYTVYSNSLYLQVMNMYDPRKADTTKLDTTQHRIFSIKDPINTPLTFKEFIQRFWWILVILAIIIGIVALIIYARKRRANAPVRQVYRPKEPAHVSALRKLDDLKAQKLWQQGSYKQFHSQLTEIIRTYIEERFDIPAMERTSAEVLESFNSHAIIDGNAFLMLKQMLITADFVKFAKAVPVADENELSMNNGYDFVLKTKPVFQPATETKVEPEAKQL